MITASTPSASAIDVNLSTGGTASGTDVVLPPPVVTLPANASSLQVVVATHADNLVETNKTFTLSVAGGSADYTVGSPSTAQTTIVDANVPEVHISGGGSVSPGGSRTLTITADQAPVRDTQISVTVAGDTTPLQDYQSVNPTVVMKAGRTTATFAINTIASDSIQPSKHVTAALTPAAGYRVGSPGSAVVTIAGQTGNAALPIVTLRSAAAQLTKGEPYPITVSLERGDEHRHHDQPRVRRRRPRAVSTTRFRAATSWCRRARLRCRSWCRPSPTTPSSPIACSQ